MNFPKSKLSGKALPIDEMATLSCDILFPKPYVRTKIVSRYLRRIASFDELPKSFLFPQEKFEAQAMNEIRKFQNMNVTSLEVSSDLVL